MLIRLLKSKIHRATVTDARVDYTGSITIDKSLMEEADIKQYEKVLVASIDSGQRLETYVIEGEKGSGEICLNGAAAKIIKKAEKIIIMSFCFLTKEEAADFHPKIVHVDGKNHVINGILNNEINEEC